MPSEGKPSLAMNSPGSRERASSPPHDFEQLYSAHLSGLRAYARRLHGADGGGDDLLQLCAERMYRKFHLYRAHTNFLAWGRQIMFNLYLTQYRKHQRWRELNELIPARASWLRGGTAENCGGDSYDHALLLRLLDSLSPCLRTAFGLRYEGLSYQEIAREVNAPVGTVKSRVFIARQKLRAWATELYAEA